MEISKDDTFINCPRCGSPIPYMTGTIRIRCPYCGKEIDVEAENAKKNNPGAAKKVSSKLTEKQEQTPEGYEVRSIYEIQHRDEPEDAAARQEKNSVKKVFSIVIFTLIFITFIFLIISLIAQTGA